MKRFIAGFTTGVMVIWCVFMFGVTAAMAQYKAQILSPPVGFNETDGKGIFGSQRVGAGRVAGAPNPEQTHALLWIGTSAVDLNPAGYTYSRAYDTDGVHQVGAAWLGEPGQSVLKGAGIWSGTPESFVQLCRLDTCGNYALALAIGGDQQVGYADYSSNGGGGRPESTRDIRAALWRGTPDSYVDLDPTTLGYSDETRALDTDGMQQVGWGYFALSPRPYRALLWRGTRESVVDLSPVGFELTFAQAVKLGVQAGYGQNYDQGSLTMPHALVWAGSAASVSDLGEGLINDTNGKQHVGRSSLGHAFVWTGKSPAGTDLHVFLPPGVYVYSGAERIDSLGNIIGWAQRADSYFLEAVVWQRTGRLIRGMAAED